MIEIKRFGYYWLNNWGLANMIQLATQDFCARYLNHSDAHSGRQYDQMTQVARSASANIAEGGSRHSTSKETETKQTDVARATLPNIISFAAVALTAALLTGCADDSASDILDPTADNTEIKVNADVWQVMEGTRATTYDDDPGLQTEGHFTCAAYNANTTTAYISPTQVDWVTDKWLFSDGKHYWPASGSLDFFAYMPATKPDYISTITYAVSGVPAPQPSFVCDELPMTNGGQSSIKEFIYALTPGQNKTTPGASGVTMTFTHPFARVKFVLSAASGTNVKINSITIPGLYTGGTYTHGTGWASLTGDPTDLVISGDPATGDTHYLVIPNNYGTKTLTVNATWDDWSNVSKNVSADVTINWQPGYSYTYTLTLSKYALIVDVAKYTEQW